MAAKFIRKPDVSWGIWFKRNIHMLVKICMIIELILNEKNCVNKTVPVIWKDVNLFMMPLTSSASNDSNTISSEIALKSFQHQKIQDVDLESITYIDENENFECLSQTDCFEEDATTNEK